MENSTLAQQLQPSAINFNILHKNYGPMLGLVRELIGVVPNCDPILEIWLIGFRTYNLLVPNCLNLPFSVFGWGLDKAIMGLAMYSSSRAASCAYCITPAIIALVSSHLTHAIMVEIIVWLSVQQLLHRVDCFYSLP